MTPTLLFLLAVALLTAPPEAPAGPVLPGELPLLQGIALSLEILDERETNYVFHRPEDFAGDLALLRRRWQDLRDAPRVADAERLPDRDTINDLIAFNRKHRDYLTACQWTETSRADEWRERIQETDAVYQVLDTMRDARCDYFFCTVRRAALKKLRGVIGLDAFAFGRWPGPIPQHRLREIP